MALDDAKDSDNKAEEKGYSFCMDKQLLAQVQHVTINYSYMGFSVDPEVPLPGGGGKCGGCESAGNCSPDQ